MKQSVQLSSGFVKTEELERDSLEKETTSKLVFFPEIRFYHKFFLKKIFKFNLDIFKPKLMQTETFSLVLS